MFQVKWEWTGLGGAPWLSTFVFAGTVGTGGPQDAVNASRTFLATTPTLYSNLVRINVVPFVDTVSADGVLTDRTAVTAAEIVGTSNGDPLPFTTQSMLRLSTGVFQGGREIRGRLFLGGGTEDANTGGRPLSTIITALNVKAAALAADPAEWSVWSRKNKTVSPVASATMWNQWAVLRSRRD